MPGTIRMMNAQGDARPVLAACTTSEMSRSNRIRTNGIAAPTRSVPAQAALGCFIHVRICRLGADLGSSSLREMRHEAGEQSAPVGAADGRLHMVFRMRHQAEHVE